MATARRAGTRLAAATSPGRSPYTLGSSLSCAHERARVLRQAWEEFFISGAVPAIVRPAIAQSWLRSRQLGIHPTEQPHPIERGLERLLSSELRRLLVRASQHVIDRLTDLTESSTLSFTLTGSRDETFGTDASATPLEAGATSQLPPGHPPIEGMAPPNMNAAASQHMSGGAADEKVSVPPAAGGKTVATVWAERIALAGKPVVVRGKVVKYLGGILGKNWLHIRDGSGSADVGDFDLTVTTDEVAAVGDVVVVRGTVRADKDFGAGYKYAVIVEDATIEK